MTHDTSVRDIHPHIISADDQRYPIAPLYGTRSNWSGEGAFPVEALLAAMDDAGVAKAAVVHSSTTYGFDNAYVLDSCAAHKQRLVAVGSVDMLADDAVEVVQRLARRGLSGLRIFTGGSTRAVDPGELDDPRSFRVWDALAELALPVCIQTQAVGLPQVTRLARRYPATPVILDHLTAPDLTDGPPYAAASSLFALAEQPNVYLKITPRTFADVTKGDASAETFFPLLVDRFGAHRLAWGSNTPASPGGLKAILAIAQAGLASLSDDDRSWIFGRTAAHLYPGLS